MIKKIILNVAILGSLLVPAIAFATGPLDLANKKLDNALSGTNLESNVEVSIGTVVRAILSLAGTIFLLLTVYAGILWMTAQGAQEQIEKAQNIVSAAIIGLFITMAAYAITTFVTTKLGNVSVGGSTQNNTGAAQNQPVKCYDTVVDTNIYLSPPVCRQACDNGAMEIQNTDCSQFQNAPHCCALKKP